MSCWFGGTVSGRDSAFHVEYDTSLGGLTLSHQSYYELNNQLVQVMDWGDGSPLEVWDTVGYDWTTYSLIHTYATSGTYRVKTWWVPKDSTQNPPSDIYGYTFGHPKNGRWAWMGNEPSSYNSRIGLTELINFGPSSPNGLFDDYLNHQNLSMTYLQDGIKEDLDTRYMAYRWASGCKLKNTYNPKVWAMFDTRKLVEMTNFFNNTTNRNSGLNFNPDVTMWDVGSVQLFNEMFAYLYGFDQDLSNWDVSSATNMSVMFSNALAFNNGGATGIDDWDVSNVTTMTSMFLNADAFNQPIGNWDVSNVTNMTNMFYLASAFNQPIGNWNTSNVTNMTSMFYLASAFNNGGATGIDDWDVSNVTNMTNMFRSTPFNQPIGNWDVSNVTNISQMFMSAASFNQPIGNWNTSNVTTMTNMFNSAQTFDQDLSNWNVSNVTNMRRMFSNAYAFNNGGATGMNNWDVSNVTNFTQMFSNARNFNQDISSWGISGDGFSGVSIGGMYGPNCYAFNNGGATGIGDWNVSNVTSFNQLFQNNFVFNHDLSRWDTSSNTTMSSMFYGCSVFNNGGATGINDWDVSNVTGMRAVFYNADAFNQPIGNWDVSNVTTFDIAFSVADAFNQDISGWDTSSVSNFFRMFRGSTSFDQDLGNWNISSTTNMSGMLENCGMSDENYSRALVGWANFVYDNSGPYNITLGASGLQYHSTTYTGYGSGQFTDAVSARAYLTGATAGWTITDSGQA